MMPLMMHSRYKLQIASVLLILYSQDDNITSDAPTRSCDFTEHLCTGIIHENYKLFHRLASWPQDVPADAISMRPVKTGRCSTA